MANSGNKNPGNFSNDREKASEAGRKGGQSSGGRSTADQGSKTEAGRKGGQHGPGSAGGKKS